MKVIPLEAVMSSNEEYNDHLAALCIDGIVGDYRNYCHTGGVRGETHPWVALHIPPSTVTTVKITPRNGGFYHRLRNVRVMVGSGKPTSFSEWFTEVRGRRGSLYIGQSGTATWTI